MAKDNMAYIPALYIAGCLVKSSQKLPEEQTSMLEELFV